MKSLLFAAIALSLILMVSAQCDLNAVITCSTDFTNMVNKHCMAAAILLCMHLHDNYATIVYMLA